MLRHNFAEKIQTMENTGFISYSRAEMLEEWKKRRGFYSGVRTCEVEREDGVDLDGVLQREMDNWYGRLLREAPAEMLPVEDVAGECETEVDSRRVVAITLPARCVRALDVRLEGWKSVVTRFAAPDSLEAEAQRSEWTQAGIERPVVVEGVRQLTAYSAPATGDVKVARLRGVCRPADGSYSFRSDAWTWLPGYFDLV